MEAKLKVLVGQAKGREIPLPASQFIIGRDSVCHLRPHSSLVSKFHCAIGRNAAGDVVVRDLKSSNKTYVNNQPISGTVPAADGDLLGIGPLQFQLIITEDADPPTRQPLTQEHFHWLMKEASDSFDLDSDTTIVGLPAYEFDEDQDAATEESSLVEPPTTERPGPVSREMSAGRYLRDFLGQQESSVDVNE